MIREYRNILVIKLRNIGDVLLSSPVARRLKEAYPHAKVTFVVNAGTESMLTLNPCIYDILVFDRRWKRMPLLKRTAAEFAFSQRIRRAGYDLVLDLTEGDRGAMLAFMARKAFRIGWDPGHSGFPGKRHIFHHLVSPGLSRHIIDWNLLALEPLGIECHTCRPELHFSSEDALKVKALLRERGIGEGRKIVHVHPTARWLFKCWRPERVASVLDHLYERHGLHPVVTSGPEPREAALIRGILDAARTPLVDLSGRLTLKQVAALSRRSAFFFGVDTAPMHMAGAVGVPVAAVFGPSNETVWGPRAPWDLLIRKDMPCRPCSRDGCNGTKISRCLEELKPDEVISALDAWLGSPAISRACARDVVR
jgi:heptosyltransferase-3